ncbi:MAG: purine-binding chemotaxis protein CheW [Nitrospinae bacterium]|nr:purine-binding chemotaxis protein CheW [Nitrospinota bacterium]
MDVPVESKSDEVLAQISQRADDAQIVDVEEEKTQIIVFTIGGGVYAIPGSDAKEVLEPGKITRIPGCPEYLLGVINVRGDVESVIDLARFLGLPQGKETAKKQVIIAEKNGVRSGLVVGSVEDVVDVPVRAIQPSLSTLDERIKHYVSGETEHGGKSVTMLDVGKMFERLAAE